MNETEIVRLTPKGLYCEAGDFYIDPWQPVSRALITHAHGDHAHTGNGSYLACNDSVAILQHRLGADAKVDGVPYGQVLQFGSAAVSFHPAGHILGSSQIRVNVDGKVWVVSGDYKRDPDPTCPEFEVLECDTFITEATFALPIYRWDPGPVWAKEIFDWWTYNRERGHTSLLYCYALGKAQRVLAELTAYTNETVFLHGAVDSITRLYRDAGVGMLPAKVLNDDVSKKDLQGSLVIAPPSATHPAWLKRLGTVDTGFASGWMRVRGAKRRKGYDRGFVVSDHADWTSLIRTIKETKARRILATHGETSSIVKFLHEQSINAAPLKTSYGDEGED